MNDHEQENWFHLYKTAMVEVEHAAMMSCIGVARAEIASRLEKLKELPGLHTKEHQAIQDALDNLSFLEREGERFAAQEKKRIWRETMQKFQPIIPECTDSGNQQDPN